MNESNELMKLKTDNDITILFNNKLSINEIPKKLSNKINKLNNFY